MDKFILKIVITGYKFILSVNRSTPAKIIAEMRDCAFLTTVEINRLVCQKKNGKIVNLSVKIQLLMGLNEEFLSAGRLDLLGLKFEHKFSNFVHNTLDCWKQWESQN